MVDIGDPLVKETLVHDVAERLRTLILTGEMLPGMRLRQEDLSRGLGVSRTPLRQALGLLVEEGFVERSPKAQYAVTTMNQDSLLDLYRVRRELDGLAASLAAQRRSDIQLTEMSNELQLMKDAQPHEWFIHHQRFHVLIYEASMNTYLQRHKNAILLSTRLFNPQLAASQTRREQSFSEQVQIWSAIEAQDSTNAKRKAKNHITNAMKLLSPEYSGNR